MEVKGTGLITTREFVIAKYPLLFNQWIEELPHNSRVLLKSEILNTAWYPMSDAYLVPMDFINNKFYNNPELAGVELGRFSAELALTGIYKAFIMFSSPWFMLKKASTMISTYYKPCSISARESGINQITLSIKEMPLSSKVFEFRIAGWCQRALELSKCQNVQYRIVRHLSTGALSTDIILNWE